MSDESLDARREALELRRLELEADRMLAETDLARRRLETERRADQRQMIRLVLWGFFTGAATVAVVATATVTVLAALGVI